MVVSATTTSLILGTANPVLLAVGAVAGLLPDVDISTSAAGRVLPWVSHFLERRFPHRICTHSLFASGVVSVVVYGSAFLLGGKFLSLAHAITIGYFFGWFIDAFTKTGVEMFWPDPLRCVCPGNRKFRIKSGSTAEYILLVILTLLAFVIFNINTNGGVMTQFNRLTSRSANSFIFYGKGGEIATNRLSDQELAVLCLHLLQISLVYINTLMIQQVLSQAQWMKLMKQDDLRALSPLIWAHVNPYGTFRLDMNERLPIEAAA